jgi:UTP--glucose-1-phosphate uridylyltransferase
LLVSAEAVAAAAAKMRQAGQSEAAIRHFSQAIERVAAGERTLIPSAEIEPVLDVPGLAELPAADPRQALARLAVIRLNGGIATSMGLRQPKSLLEAREGHSFLEVIAGQILELRRRHGVPLPLILMNSQATHEPTREALDRIPELANDGLPQDFLQSMVPKLEAGTLLPARWPQEPDLEWCPPGHGDVYASLAGSGLLAALREQGYRHAMIANSDNLAATVDPRIAAHIAAQRIPFLLEVVRGTASDRKGGHLARRCSDGQLVLRETAQTPAEDASSFLDYRRWRYYNTNSLWVDLEALEARFASGATLELPVIVNHKTLDPRDPDSPAVLQLESAMGAAISSFPGACLLEVPRSRFVPVKTTDDLLVLRSDCFRMADGFLLEAMRPGASPPEVALDKDHFGLIDDFDRRFAAGPPSLLAAERLIVNGDVCFGAGVVVRGSVQIDAPPGGLTVEPGTILDSAVVSASA